MLDPDLVVLTGSVLKAGGDRLLDQVRSELADLAVARPTIELSGIPDRPVLQGGLCVALAAVRDEVFDTIQSSQAVGRS